MTDAPQWLVVDLPDGVQVEHIADSSLPGYVVVAGSRDGVAYAAEVQGPPRSIEFWDPVIEIPVPEETSSAVSARVVRATYAGVLGVCGPTTLWGRNRRIVENVNEGWLDYVVHPNQIYDLPVDETGAQAVWVWVTKANGDLQATAAYPTADGRHEIRVLDRDTFALLERDRPLITSAPLEDLLVAASAGRVAVAGPITDPLSHPGTAPGELTSWWASSAQLDPNEYRYWPPWDSNTFTDPPVRLLGCGSGDAMSGFLGLTADGVVALWDADGELRETSGLRVNPEDPVAVIAELDVWGAYDEEEYEEPLGLAAYAAATPKGNVFTCRGMSFAMPAGRLRAAVVTQENLLRCYALIDETVYVLAFDYPPYKHFHDLVIERRLQSAAAAVDRIDELGADATANPVRGAAPEATSEATSEPRP